jgi:two-component sensor histidine kinase
MTTPQSRPRATDRRPESRETARLRTDDLERALAEKTTLLHEVDHRVKNNLQLISSLLLLQARRADDPTVKQALRSAQSRVNAVAIAHRRLFQGADPGLFDVSDFVRDMVGDAIGVSGRTDISVRLDLERVDLPASQAAPLALLLGELLGNVIRHAFRVGEPGQLSVSTATEDHIVRIEIADNGVGLSATESGAGFGGTIVRLMCQQLHAECETVDASPGARSAIRLPL